MKLYKNTFEASIKLVQFWYWCNANIDAIKLEYPTPNTSSPGASPPLHKPALSKPGNVWSNDRHNKHNNNGFQISVHCY